MRLTYKQGSRVSFTYNKPGYIPINHQPVVLTVRDWGENGRIARQSPLSLTFLLGFAGFCHSPELLEMGEVGYTNLTSKNFSLLDHLASAMIV